MKKRIAVAAGSAALAAGSIGLGWGLGVGPSGADQLPENCTKDRGQVTCTTFDGPGKNQAGVGTTSIDTSQGNLTNKKSTQTTCVPNTQSANCIAG